MLVVNLLPTKVSCRQSNANRSSQYGVGKKERLSSGEQFVKQSPEDQKVCLLKSKFPPQWLAHLNINEVYKLAQSGGPK